MLMFSFSPWETNEESASIFFSVSFINWTGIWKREKEREEEKKKMKKQKKKNNSSYSVVV